MTDTQDKLAKMRKMIDDIGIGMLTTVETDGSLRSRPMHVADIDADGRVWMLTKASAHKVLEVARDRHVCLTFADPDGQDYVSLSGEARIHADRDKIDALWTGEADTWFPDGKDDPDAAALAVELDYAEYWDAPSAAMVTLYGKPKKALTGEPPTELGAHGKV